MGGGSGFVGSGRWARRAALVVGLCGVLSGAAAHAGEDPREAKGRSLFATGEYQAALDIFVNLFGEKGDPVYLRNIGRCYQKLRQPAKAIDAFQEYLLRYQRLKPAERREVEGFIQQMNKLKAEQEAEARPEPAPPPHIEPTPTPPPPSLAPPPPPKTAADSDDNGGTAPLVTAHPDQGSGDQAGSRPITSHWWFWAGAGAVVVGGVVAALVLTSGGGTVKPPCQAPYNCP
jgi:hypothetical protein